MRPDANSSESARSCSALNRSNRVAEDVIDFCELGGYIDMPVRTYSTGMLVRSAFALVTSVTSEILLFDELIGGATSDLSQGRNGACERSWSDRASSWWQPIAVPCSTGGAIEHFY